MLLPIHIAAGGLAIVLGAVALLVKKGGNIHRRVGLPCQRCGARINKSEETVNVRSIDRVARTINYLPVPLFRSTQGSLDHSAFGRFRLQPVIRFTPDRDRPRRFQPNFRRCLL